MSDVFFVKPDWNYYPIELLWLLLPINIVFKNNFCTDESDASSATSEALNNEEVIYI